MILNYLPAWYKAPERFTQLIGMSPVLGNLEVLVFIENSHNLFSKKADITKNALS